MNHQAHRPIRRHIKALSSMLQLFDSEIDARFWHRVRVRLADLVQRTATTDFDVELETHFRTFDPVVLYRRDPSLWEVAIYVADQNGNVIAFHFDKEESLDLFALGRRFRSESSFFQREPETLESFREAVSKAATENIGRDKFFALWVNRGYDTLLRISQISVLRENFGKEFTPKLALRDQGNIFEVSDVLPFVNEVCRVAEPAVWRKQLDLQTQLIEFIEISGELGLDCHPSMIALIRQMSGRENVLLDANIAEESFVLLISLDFEKRRFMGQEAFVKQVIAYISLQQKPIVLIVNGMTGMVDAPDEFPQIGAAESEIIKQIIGYRPGVKVIHMHDHTFVEKASLYKHADYFLAPLGNASIIPQALGIPGIMYGPPAMLAQFGWIRQAIPSQAALIDQSWSTVVGFDAALTNYDWGHDDGSRESYDVDREKLSSLAVRHIDEVIYAKFGFSI